MICNRIINKTFEEIDSFSKLIITFKIFKQEKKIEPGKTTFLKCVILADINAL